MHLTIPVLYRQHLEDTVLVETSDFWTKPPNGNFCIKPYFLCITFSGLDDDPTTSFARLGNPFSDPVGVEDLVQNELEF